MVKSKSKNYLCYCLKGQVNRKGKDTSYVGITNNFTRRIRQHNGELKSGGARYTRGHRPWLPLFQVHGFQTKNQVMRFEWALKKRRRSRKGATSHQLRCITLEYLLSAPTSESTACMINELPPLHVKIFCSKEKYLELLRGEQDEDTLDSHRHRYTFNSSN